MNPTEHKWERKADAVLGLAASVLLFCMMVLTFADVVGRYLLNRPIRGAFEITELALLVLIFAGLPLVSHADEHVTMDFIDRLLPVRMRDAWIRAMHALCAALMFFLAWQTWIKAGKIAGYGDTTDVLRILVGPFVYFMTAMIALTGGVHVYKMFVPGAARASQATT
ncbi:MAG TPA: TRAP transporter small permease [Burkholderiales bacterium]|nr:TRAP transporter small permease [Burkholderiales bacterium]